MLYFTKCFFLDICRIEYGFGWPKFYDPDPAASRLSKLLKSGWICKPWIHLSQVIIRTSPVIISITLDNSFILYLRVQELSSWISLTYLGALALRLLSHVNTQFRHELFAVCGRAAVRENLFLELRYAGDPQLEFCLRVIELWVMYVY